MSGRTKLIGVILAVLAMVSFVATWTLYKKYSLTPVSTSLMDRTKGVVEKNPRLQPDWDKAMEDRVLTWPEANAILEKVGEKAEPEN